MNAKLILNFLKMKLKNFTYPIKILINLIIYQLFLLVCLNMEKLQILLEFLFQKDSDIRVQFYQIRDLNPILHYMEFLK